MQAMVGQEAPFDHGRQQLKLLADLEVTTKAVERAAEAIGENIAAHEQVEIQRAMQLDLPIVVGKPVPILYVQMDGTGVPVVKKETVGRKGKTEGQPAHTREAKLGCVFTRVAGTKRAIRSAIRIPPPTPAPSRPPKRLASASTWKPGSAAGAAPKRRSSWAMGRMDLESCRATLPRRDSDRRSVSRAPTPVGAGPQAASQRRSRPGKLDEGPPGHLLDKGKIEKLVGALRSIDSSNPELAEKIRTEADYFESNAERMRYPEFRGQHLFVGSGVIEAGCKTVIGSRLKQSGHVLDRSRSQRHHRPAMLPSQRPLRGLLGGAPPGGLISTSTSHTPVIMGVRLESGGMAGFFFCAQYPSVCSTLG